MENLDKVIRIDQSPIGRTPRSNPATYTGLFTPIRDLYAMLPESRERGYKPGRFSFNVKGGRCEACPRAGSNSTPHRPPQPPHLQSTAIPPSRPYRSVHHLPSASRVKPNQHPNHNNPTQYPASTPPPQRTTTTSSKAHTSTNQQQTTNQHRL